MLVEFFLYSRFSDYLVRGPHKGTSVAEENKNLPSTPSVAISTLSPKETTIVIPSTFESKAPTKVKRVPIPSPIPPVVKSPVPSPTPPGVPNKPVFVPPVPSPIPPVAKSPIPSPVPKKITPVPPPPKGGESPPPSPPPHKSLDKKVKLFKKIDRYVFVMAIYHFEKTSTNLPPKETEDALLKYFLLYSSKKRYRVLLNKTRTTLKYEFPYVRVERSVISPKKLYDVVNSSLSVLSAEKEEKMYSIDPNKKELKEYLYSLCYAVTKAGKKFKPEKASFLAKIIKEGYRNITSLDRARYMFLNHINDAQEQVINKNIKTWKKANKDVDKVVLDIIKILRVKVKPPPPKVTSPQ